MKAALIGTGQIAQQHLGCLSSLSDVTLAGVCDLSRALAESTAERFKVAAWFTDHREMLDKTRPDVVHITTPPSSHFSLAMDALAAGAHVIVEKPLTMVHDQVAVLLRAATERNRVLIEDYNYLYNPPIQTVLGLMRTGDLGEILNVEVAMAVDILADGSPFADRDVPHPCLAMPGGAIGDFLPHMASLIHAFIGRQRTVRTHWSKQSSDSPIPFDEFRGIVVAERGTASVSFSSQSPPEMFWVRVNGTKMRATVDIFDETLILNRLDEGPRPLARLNDRLREGRDIRAAARRNLLGKVMGRSTYAGLWSLVAQTYHAIKSGTEPPVTRNDILEINDMVRALTAEEFQF
jgi:predicted dehydrogenase